jgi:hypothetical protein
VQAVAHGCFHFEEGTRRISYSLTGKTVKMVNPGLPSFVDDRAGSRELER